MTERETTEDELAKQDRCPTCSDHDEDCDDLPDKVGCWLYAPERGMCPYLRASSLSKKEEK